ncbi:Px [Subterranean clover mottle virus]|uniref:Px n=1 Tax=Subterranean clover mottle virus TaxID=12472 RepID=UPI0003D4071A|nr:Px [Subterranean clover mottle virus]
MAQKATGRNLQTTKTTHELHIVPATTKVTSYGCFNYKAFSLFKKETIKNEYRHYSSNLPILDEPSFEHGGGGPTGNKGGLIKPPVVSYDDSHLAARTERAVRLARLAKMEGCDSEGGEPARGDKLSGGAFP